MEAMLNNRQRGKEMVTIPLETYETFGQVLKNVREICENYLQNRQHNDNAELTVALALSMAHMGLGALHMGNRVLERDL